MQGGVLHFPAPLVAAARLAGDRTGRARGVALGVAARGDHAVRTEHHALAAARAIDTEEIFVFGGASIYAEAFPHTDRLYLTVINDSASDADVYFPDYSAFTKEVSREDRPDNEPPYSWLTLEC